MVSEGHETTHCMFGIAYSVNNKGQEVSKLCLKMLLSIKNLFSKSSSPQFLWKLFGGGLRERLDFLIQCTLARFQPELSVHKWNVNPFSALLSLCILTLNFSLRKSCCSPAYCCGWRLNKWRRVTATPYSVWLWLNSTNSVRKPWIRSSEPTGSKWKKHLLNFFRYK